MWRRTVSSIRRYGAAKSISSTFKVRSYGTNERIPPAAGMLSLSFAVGLVVSAGFLLDNTTSAEPLQLRKPGLSTFPDEFLVDLSALLTDHQIELDVDECATRGKPHNSYHHSEYYPKAIVFPESTEQVSQVVKLCNKYNVPIIPFGGGTSLEGQTLSTSTGISLDFKHMKRILELNASDLDVRVEAGLGYIELNELLHNRGLWFPLDPGPGASVGGMCACRCSGSTAVRYGSMRENVLSLTAVLADGSIVQTGSRARKSSAGYDITRLLIGSEGTLAIITEATLKLHGIPKISHAVRISFPDVVQASLTAKNTLNCEVTIGRCELLDKEMVKLINASNPLLPNPWPEHTTLLYEITGISEQSVAEQTQIVADLARKNGAIDIQTATTVDECKDVWKVRKECLWSAMSQFPDKDVMITDVCVPLSQLPALINDTKKDIASSESLSQCCPIVAHAGDGNFHVFILFKADDPAEVAQAKQLASNMALQAIALGGTCTGEHGIGVGKKQYLAKEMGANTMALMKQIKNTMDPKNIMNPGKVLDADD